MKWTDKDLADYLKLTLLMKAGAALALCLIWGVGQMIEPPREKLKHVKPVLSSPSARS